MTGASQEVNL